MELTADAFSPAEIRLLADLGFAAAGRADVARAETIFAGLRDLRATRAFPYIGLATAYMNAGRPDEAVLALQSALEHVQDERAEIDAFLGLALQMAGRTAESGRALERAAGGPQQSDGARLARHMLGRRD